MRYSLCELLKVMGHRKERKGQPNSRGGIAGGVTNQRNTLAVKAETAIGRHPCKCQARIHALVRNCMGCGKIVCVQEGSGPCFFCGNLVCTKEEKEERHAIIQRRLELEEIKERRKRNIIINLNVKDITVSEGVQNSDSYRSYDPVIESILEKSEERRRAADAAQNSAVDAHWIPKGFVPKTVETEERQKNILHSQHRIEEEERGVHSCS
ncbi:hypothetical protein TELCIR_10669 [Teladorsagia circumcincta]|uniref:TRIP4/RQT4 C2HC5-type zinc finger domain-containing protein n=1 Tax=Teladorsagia circumcincta TaxID=45464 RepID=A0A2G9UBK6_TELCI|nr:hypothetical protein TELCIR_10669 [Teladorsagia circumcincta]